MGFQTQHYWRVGRFAELASGEDVDQVDRFRAAVSGIYWDDELWVTTSAAHRSTIRAVAPRTGKTESHAAVCDSRRRHVPGPWWWESAGRGESP
jgi:hypothetical protein